MPFKFRKRINVLPFFRLNASKSGVSRTWHFWRWSYNSRTRRHSIDLPGIVNWQSEPRPRARQRDDEA